MQWRTIYRKEMLEYWRNFSWIWVPIVFIILAIMDPITSYYLPIIIDNVGGLPEGASVEIPEVNPTDALMMSLSEFSMFGVLVIIFITMGLIAGERKSGVAELILVKPVHYATYISSKWAAKLTLVLTSYIIGLFASWYYVNLLFGNIAFSALVQTIGFYGLWFVLVLTITVFFSCLFKSSGVVLGSTIGTLLLMFSIYNIFSHVLTWFPNSLSSHIREMLQTGSVPNALWGTSFITVGSSLILLIVAYVIFQKKEVA
ncbi:putative transmembrane protein YxlG [Paraliobacillus ryukyuensis]|uniref:ABC-2 type transport system permease protein n=1 Tax=Paraliobacillus ryukyuensis TaxID=200904 RepID=A0A366DZA8_9BACI|nr:ABC transporter permease subunit [Paraliobacillus ryukyuensis]RBO95377.1 ABC-2 type transport system permease protein [Paraliobacillus ryukyuensis]